MNRSNWYWDFGEIENSRETYIRSSSKGFTSLSTSLLAPPTNINGKLSQGPANSLKSDASDARDDLRDDARDEVAVPRLGCKCRKFSAESLACQPPPGLEVWVCSSSCDNGERSRSFFILLELSVWLKNNQMRDVVRETWKEFVEWLIWIVWALP